MVVSKYWFEEYGARVVAMERNTLQYYLEEPIRDYEVALQIAKEQFGFCPDRVLQDTSSETIEELADSLVDATIWHFWWD